MPALCEIRIYDKDFNWVGVVKTAESVILERNHQDIGSFEIHIQPDKKNAKILLQRGNFVIFNGDFRKIGIIRDFYLEESREGAEQVIYGDTASGILKQRSVIPPTKAENPTAYGYDRVSGAAETVFKHYINRHLINPTDAKRKIPYLRLKEDLKRGIQMPWQARFTNLNETIAEICAYADMGYEFVFNPDGRTIEIDVVEGTDRSKSQSVHSPVTFRLENKTISSYRYTEDHQNYKSTGICGGAGEDENRLIYTLGTEFEGIDRWEVFLDCGNAADTNELIYYGQQKLAEYISAITLEADALPRNFIFEQDFYLGDKVTAIIDRLNIQLDLRITSVNEIWERDSGYRYEIRFGAELPNIYKVLKTQKEVR